MPTKDPEPPENFSFKGYGMEVSGTGRFPVICAVIFVYVVVPCAAGFTLGKLVGWW
ncbi:hypothetical protein [Ensifer adhaerens]